MKNSPCKTCAKINPKICRNLHCVVWRLWWITTWNTNRLKVLAALTKKEERSDG